MSAPQQPTLTGPNDTVTQSARPVAWWMLLCVALLAAGVYANSLYNGFAFDDWAIVKNNQHVVDMEWSTIWTDNYWPKNEGIQPDALYRPLTLWSYVANQFFTPGSPGPFHFINVALHALVSVLVSMLTWRLLGNRVVAVVAGVLFAVHPLHTEVVANTVGRAELLAATWSLLALIIFLQNKPLGEDRPPVIGSRLPLLQFAVVAALPILVCVAVEAVWRFWKLPDVPALYLYGLAVGAVMGLLALCAKVPGLSGVRPAWHGLLVGACFFAAILSKETPITLLLAIPLIDVWRWTRWSPQERPRWWLWLSTQATRYYAPMAAFTGIYMVLRVRACGLMSDSRVIHHVVNPLVEANVMERIFTPFSLLAKYVMLTFWPLHLSADYSSPSLLPSSNLFVAPTPMTPPAILGVLVLALAALVAVMMWKKLPQIALLVVMFLTSYFLVSNVIRIGTIFGERLFYWPSVFVLIMIAWALVGGYQAIQKEFHGPRARYAQVAAWILLAIPVGLMAVRTWIRNPDWKDNIHLAFATAYDNPFSGKACSWAGATLVMSDNPEDVPFGKILIERAIELSPDYVSARWELAKYYGLHGELGESAICVAKASRYDPGTHLTRSAIPALLADMKKDKDLKYLPAIEGYLKEHPDEDAANLAMAFAYHAQGGDKLDEAEKYARRALDLGQKARPDGVDQYHEAGAEIASIQFDLGLRDNDPEQIQKALKEFRIYTTYMRNSSEAHLALAALLLTLDVKKYPEAIDEARFNIMYAEALEANTPYARQLKGQLNSIVKNLNKKDLDKSVNATASVVRPEPVSPAGVGP